MDLEAVRTVLAVADAGQFQHAAAELSVTQQAVSKRVAALERELGVRLFTRTPRGAQLTAEGQAFLPHARELVRVAQRARVAVRAGRAVLRVDVIGRKLAPARLLGGFQRAHPGTALDAVTRFDVAAAVAALHAGEIDASFRAVVAQTEGIESERVHDEPLQLLTGPAHPLAGAAVVTPAQLAGHRIWMPGIVAGTEWSAYYEAFGTAFGIDIEASGPQFGADPLLDTLAGSRSLATLVGEGTHVLWPPEWDLRRIAVRDPTPVYPHSLLWRTGERHPALGLLRHHLAAQPPTRPEGGTWRPLWARAERPALTD